MYRLLVTSLLSLIIVSIGWSQKQFGINIDPVRSLHTYGPGDQYVRVRSNSFALAETGVELIRGFGDNLSTDWRLANDGGHFSIQYSNMEFNSNITEALHIDTEGNVGVGTDVPDAPLHVNSGTSIAGGGGYLYLGSASTHLAFDHRGISARAGGSPSGLSLQPEGGNTYLNPSGGDVFMAMDNSSTVDVGGVSGSTKLQVGSGSFQMCLRNNENGVNDWFIGASNPSWFVGDHQLIFSPTSSSNDAVFRLANVDDNDGNYAPVMIHSTNAQTLLLDGNEIDTRSASMYINYNSQNNTYFNSNGGLVGIGTSNPQAVLHVTAHNFAGPTLALQKNSAIWSLNPSNNLGGLSFFFNDTFMAQISGSSGVWDSPSDMRLKEDIIPMYNVADKLEETNVYTYSFRHDPEKSQHIGVLAQELEEQFPELVHYTEGQYGVAYAQLAIVALKAVQEQQARIDELTSRLSDLRRADHN